MSNELVIVGFIVGLVMNFLGIAGGLYKLGSVVARFELIGERQAAEITELKKAVQTVMELMTKVALQNQRQDAFADRMNNFENLLNSLRKGEGFILPLSGPVSPRSS